MLRAAERLDPVQMQEVVSGEDADMIWSDNFVSFQDSNLLEELHSYLLGCTRD